MQRNLVGWKVVHALEDVTAELDLVEKVGRRFRRQGAYISPPAGQLGPFIHQADGSKV